MDTTDSTQKTIKKKRLSRKEQKARKKQKKQPSPARHSKEEDPSPVRRDKDEEPSPTPSSCASTTSSIPETEAHAASFRLEEEGDYDDKPAVKTRTRTTTTTTAAFDLSSYVPTPIPSWDDIKREHKQSLGKWFPNAVIVKSKQLPPAATTTKGGGGGDEGVGAALVLFYQYTKQPWSESRVSLLIAYLHRIASTRHVLGGRIRVAPEGVNATVSSVSMDTLHMLALDLQHFDDVFAETHFKYIDNLSRDRHFVELKVYPVKELVFYGIGPNDAPLSNGGQHLAPRDFHAKLAQSNTVVIDVRNHYEAAIGRFDGQECMIQKQQAKAKAKEDNGEPGKKSESETIQDAAVAAAATYIDPKMRKSTDFPTWLAQEETQKQLQGKQVLMFCTGGVRCERASAYLNTKMGKQLNGIYQLQGGVENYLQEFSDGGYWRGKNYVFDKREAISKDNQDGDGGVIRRSKDKKSSSSSSQQETTTTTTAALETKCCVCSKPWDRYVGKKKCSTCGVPVLMCDKCMTDKKSTKSIMIRCDLCIEQNVTVKVNEVEYTNNGMTSKVVHHDSAVQQEPAQKGGTHHHQGESTMTTKRKAAPTVLKWGGGHATLKKDKRRFGKQTCRFGAQCVRPDCFFAHPDGRNG
jgi:predicted sulfurtransferase